MATRWQGPLDEWLERFRGWIEKATPPQALLEASIFFDFRAASRRRSTSRRSTRLAARAGDARIFLAAMAKGALTFRPPGRARSCGSRGDASTVDLKAQGISPIVFLARVYGLEVGARTSNTLGRLARRLRGGAHRAGTPLETLAEAYRFLLRLRLREQLGCSRRAARRPTSSRWATSPRSSGAGCATSSARIEAWQERAAYHYRTAHVLKDDPAAAARAAQCIAAPVPGARPGASSWRRMRRRERLEVAGVARGDHVPVLDHLAVDPARAGVDEVGLERGPRGDGPAVDRLRLDEEPRAVAHRGDRLARDVHVAREPDHVEARAQVVGRVAARDHQRVEARPPAPRRRPARW